MMAVVTNRKVIALRLLTRLGGTAERSFAFVVRARHRHDVTGRRFDRRGGDERDELLGQHQPHPFVVQQLIVT